MTYRKNPLILQAFGGAIMALFILAVFVATFIGLVFGIDFHITATCQNIPGGDVCNIGFK